MNFKHTILLSSLFLIACSTYRTVNFQEGKSSQIYRLDIPKGYNFEGIAGDHEFEKRYWYPDSSVIYFTSFNNTLNYNEIRKQGLYYDRFDAVHSRDTLTLSGQDSLGLFWKDKKLESITIGYSKVPSDRKELFEEAIKSIR